MRRPCHRLTVATKAKVVAMGASTGGPAILQTILGGLPASFPAPILVVQHVSPDFLEGLVCWLAGTTGLPVHIARPFEPALPGHVYFAPPDAHLGITRQRVLILSRGACEHGVRPSVSCLFRSVARHLEAGSIGVLLSGMGRDGAEELRLMKERGACTIAQDSESSPIHGMPGEAIRLGAAEMVLAAARISHALETLVQPDA